MVIELLPCTCHPALTVESGAWPPDSPAHVYVLYQALSQGQTTLAGGLPPDLQLPQCQRLMKTT